MKSVDGPVLVTGSGGFIGGRVVEILHAFGGLPVRASLRRWSSAVRVGRLPVDIVLCDVTDPAQVREAVAGVRSIVHCAYGNEHVTVEGTRNILAAAQAEGVDRVVHLSTMEVYGDVEGEVSEEAPVRRSGWEYRDSKIDAEHLCWRYADGGLPVTVLRPTIVYGPFSRNWTVEFARRLAAGGSFPARDDAQGTCNLVYVDDLVGVIHRALHREEGVGEAFNVNGEERITWWSYLDALNEGLGLPPLEAGGRLARRTRSAAMAPVRMAARRTLDRFERPIMEVYRTSPTAKRFMRWAEAMIRGTPSTGEYQLFRRSVGFSTDKARARLGYRARFSSSEGIRLSTSWLRHHGFVGVPELQWEPR